jgi:hypothetical protein
MQPIKLKLTYKELYQLSLYINYNGSKAYQPQAREELIVLAEYAPTIHKRLVASNFRDHRKPYPYSLPVSVARILHRRWQQEPIPDELQMVLSALDYELTRRGMKLDPVKPQIF